MIYKVAGHLQYLDILVVVLVAIHLVMLTNSGISVAEIGPESFHACLNLAKDWKCWHLEIDNLQNSVFVWYNTEDSV